MKEKEKTRGAQWVAMRLNETLNSGSVSRFVRVLEMFVRRCPIPLKSIDATIVARGFLIALKQGDGNAASRIAWALKYRSPEAASDAQERVFVHHVLMNVAKQPLHGVEEEALLGLVASGYSVKPDILLAVSVHLRERSQGKYGHLLAKVARTLKREKLERMERSGRTVSEHQKQAVSRSA